MFKSHRFYMGVMLLFMMAGRQEVVGQVVRNSWMPEPGRNHVMLSPEAAKELETKAVALLNESVDQLSQLRSIENRVRTQLQTAQLLWAYDQPQARKVVEDAMTGMKDFLENVDVGDESYYMHYQTATQLRQEAVQFVAPHDPELALNFLRSTRVLADPNFNPQQLPQHNQEFQLEMMLAGQIAGKDPARARRMAEESLEKGVSYNLINILTPLRNSDPAAAMGLASRIVAKINQENLLKSPDAVHVATSLMQMSEAASNDAAAPGAVKPLLTEQERRDLFQQMVNVALTTAVAPNSANRHMTPERHNLQNLLSTLQSRTGELEKYAPGRAALIGKRLTEVNNATDPQANLWRKYHDVINTGTVDVALEAIRQAPAEVKDGLYHQLASKASYSGDLPRAKQIINDHITNQHQRQQALKQLEVQAMHYTLQSGKLDEALSSLAALRNDRARLGMTVQLIHRISGSTNKEIALPLLERALGLIGQTGRAADFEHMNALFEIARAFAPHEPERSFEIAETLAGQFNEMSLAAVQLNNFGQKYFEDDELMMRNGNMLANIAQQLTSTLGVLARVDFDRAKAIADKMRAEVRLAAYLAIVQHALPQQASGQGNIPLRTNRRSH